jgi:hypothetical protein
MVVNPYRSPGDLSEAPCAARDHRRRWICAKVLAIPPLFLGARVGFFGVLGDPESAAWARQADGFTYGVLNACMVGGLVGALAGALLGAGVGSLVDLTIYRLRGKNQKNGQGADADGS